MKEKILKISQFEVFYLVSICLLCIVAFSFLFSATQQGSFFRNVVSALIGTLLTVTITALLLKRQSRSEELKNQNIEIFKIKVEHFKQTTQLLIKALEDNQIDENEAKEIKNAVYNLSLFASQKTIETISKFLRYYTIGSMNEKKDYIELFDVISQFRKDLSIEGVEDFASNEISAIESLLEIGFDKIYIFKKINSYIHSLKDKVNHALIKNEKTSQFSFNGIEGCYNGISFDFENDDGMLIYVLSIDYPKSSDVSDLKVGLSFFITFDVADMQKTKDKYFGKEIETLNNLSSNLGFKYVELPEDEDFIPHFYKSYPLKYSHNDRKEFIISDKTIHRRIVKDVIKLESILEL